MAVAIKYNLKHCTIKNSNFICINPQLKYQTGRSQLVRQIHRLVLLIDAWVYVMWSAVVQTFATFDTYTFAIGCNGHVNV